MRPEAFHDERDQLMEARMELLDAQRTIITLTNQLRQLERENASLRLKQQSAAAATANGTSSSSAVVLPDAYRAASRPGADASTSLVHADLSGSSRTEPIKPTTPLPPPPPPPAPAPEPEVVPEPTPIIDLTTLTDEEALLIFYSKDMKKDDRYCQERGVETKDPIPLSLVLRQRDGSLASKFLTDTAISTATKDARTLMDMARAERDNDELRKISPANLLAAYPTYTDNCVKRLEQAFPLMQLAKANWKAREFLSRALQQELGNLKRAYRLSAAKRAADGDTSNAETPPSQKRPRASNDASRKEPTSLPGALPTGNHPGASSSVPTNAFTAGYPSDMRGSNMLYTGTLQSTVHDPSFASQSGSARDDDDASLYVHGAGLRFQSGRSYNDLLHVLQTADYITADMDAFRLVKAPALRTLYTRFIGGVPPVSAEGMKSELQRHVASGRTFIPVAEFKETVGIEE